MSLGRRLVQRAFLYCFFLAECRRFLAQLPVPIAARLAVRSA